MKGRYVGLVVLLMVAIVIAGCAQQTQQPAQEKTPTPSGEKTATPAKPPDQKPIKIGVLAPFSGPFSQYGNPYLKGAQFAVEEINAKGGVMGRPIELVIRDTKNNPSEAATTFEELVYSEGVSAVIGPVSSDIGLATSRKAEELEVPLILNLAVTEKIHKESNRYTFRANPAAPLWIIAASEYIKEKGYKRIGVIVADYSFGHSIKEAVEKYISTIPGVTVQIEVAPVRESDFTPYLRKMADLNPEFMLVTGHPPGAKIIMKQALELGFQSEGYIGAALLEDEWVSALGKSVTKGAMCFAGADYSSEEYRKVAERYRAKTGEYLNYQALTGYVTILHLAWAIDKAGSDDPKKIAETIRNGKFETPLFVYPFEYTEWGDLKNARLALEAFREGEPPGNINPGAFWKVETVYVSSNLPALPPQK